MYSLRGRGGRRSMAADGSQDASQGGGIGGHSRDVFIEVSMDNIGAVAWLL